jgi:hypothetical protein
MVFKRTAAVTAMFFAFVLPAAAIAQAPRCLQDASDAAQQRTRREAAVRYLQQVNMAQASSWQERRTYVPLAVAVGSHSIPFGFIARLIFDQWSYIITLKDVLSPCGASFFSDQDQVIYEAQPLGGEGTETRDSRESPFVGPSRAARGRCATTLLEVATEVSSARSCQT